METGHLPTHVDELGRRCGAVGGWLRPSVSFSTACLDPGWAPAPEKQVPGASRSVFKRLLLLSLKMPGSGSKLGGDVGWRTRQDAVPLHPGDDYPTCSLSISSRRQCLAGSHHHREECLDGCTVIPLVPMWLAPVPPAAACTTERAHMACQGKLPSCRAGTG